jgi:hypothetical protein
VGSVARMTFNKTYINLRLAELQHLSRIFHIFQKQLDAYINALPDVLSYVTTAVSSTAYIEPVPSASKHIVYTQLYEELITFLLQVAYSINIFVTST